MKGTLLKRSEPMAPQQFPKNLIDLIISDEEIFVCTSWRLNTTQATAERELSDYLTFKLEFTYDIKYKQSRTQNFESLIS